MYYTLAILAVIGAVIFFYKQISKPNFWCDICGGTGKDRTNPKNKCDGCANWN